METLVIIKTLPELAKLKSYLADKDLIAVDSETTSLKKGAEIIGMSFCSDEEVGYYVVTAYWDVALKKLVYLETKEAMPDLLRSLKSKRLIMQNGVFDSSMVEDNYGVSLMPDLFYDTLVAGHLLNENRPNGLKERGQELFGDSAIKEKEEMEASIIANGGSASKTNYELYKADCDLIAKYGAKDAILTLKVFYNDLPLLYDQGLDKFFFEDESMPLLRGPTYDMNRAGLKVDADRLQNLKGELEAWGMEARSFILKEIASDIADKYPGTAKTKTFNLDSGQQLAWLLFDKMELEFNTLTDSGKAVCNYLGFKLPYTFAARREFISACRSAKGRIYAPKGTYNKKTKKYSKKDAPIRDYWVYLATDERALSKHSSKYKWVAKLLEYKVNEKLLGTYVLGIQNRVEYGIVRPEFKQIGTTSGRYSSKNPNFQNLPREDKRVKACIISRPGKVLVGADYSQLEPRVFASRSGDKRLQQCFADGDDFYSVVGLPIFPPDRPVSMKKGESNYFGALYDKERQQSKIVSLAIPYGRTVSELAEELKCTRDEAREIIDFYWESWPTVRKMQAQAHDDAKANGVVYSTFGRPRRIPQAKEIKEIYGNTKHADLPYAQRNLLNLAINHTIQSTAASITNRAAIRFLNNCKEMAATSPEWAQIRLVLQVHDSLVAESPESIAEDVAAVLQDAMENTTELPGVKLEAVPSIGKNLAEMK